MPADKNFTREDIPYLNISLARLYSNISPKKLERDIKALLNLNILLEENGFYFANISVLNKMIAKKKGLLRK